MVTFETFTVLEEEFLFKWNDDGSEKLVLKKHYIISIPTGVCRFFINIGKEESLLKVIISGGLYDMSDISFAPHVANQTKQIEPNLPKNLRLLGSNLTLEFSYTTQTYLPKVLL